MQTMLEITYFLASLPNQEKPFALLIEEPTGKAFPTEVGIAVSGTYHTTLIHTYFKSKREEMNYCSLPHSQKRQIVFYANF